MAGKTSGQGVKSILYVEDDEETRRCIGNRLRRRGFVVWEAATGLAAVDAVSNGARPDVVLLDLDLPDMDGLQAYSHVAERHPGVPTVIFSGAISRFPLPALERVVGKSGRLLEKPCAFRAVLDAIEDVLSDEQRG